MGSRSMPVAGPRVSQGDEVTTDAAAQIGNRLAAREVRGLISADDFIGRLFEPCAA